MHPQSQAGSEEKPIVFVGLFMNFLIFLQIFLGFMNAVNFVYFTITSRGPTLVLGILGTDRFDHFPYRVRYISNCSGGSWLIASALLTPEPALSSSIFAHRIQPSHCRRSV